MEADREGGEQSNVASSQEKKAATGNCESKDWILHGLS